MLAMSAYVPRLVQQLHCTAAADIDAMARIGDMTMMMVTTMRLVQQLLTLPPMKALRNGPPSPKANG
jgi:hypothetical protein